MDIPAGHKPYRHGRYVDYPPGLGYWRYRVSCECGWEDAIEHGAAGHWEREYIKHIEEDTVQDVH